MEGLPFETPPAAPVADPSVVAPASQAPPPTLATLLDRGEPLPTDRILALLRGVGAELDAVHAAGWVYGALSPAAVCVSADDRPVLMDAQIAQATLARSTAYLAPEQRHLDTDLDGRVDQYALALVAYEMLSGARRQGRSEDGSPLAILNEVRLVPGRSLRPDLRPAANDVLRRAISRDPNNRFATVAEFIDALERERVVAAPADDEAKRLAALWAVASPASLVVALGLLVVVAVATGLPRRAVTIGTDVGRWSAWFTGLLPSGEAAGDVASGISFAEPAALRTGGTVQPAPVAVGGPRVDAGRSSDGTSGGQTATAPARSRRFGASATGSSASTGTSDGSAAELTPGGTASTTSSSAATGAAAAATKGRLRVTVSEGFGAVLIDGVPRGITPYVASLAAGSHTVAVRGIGRAYQPASTTVVVTAEATSEVTFERAAP